MSLIDADAGINAGDTLRLSGRPKSISFFLGLDADAVLALALAFVVEGFDPLLGFLLFGDLRSAITTLPA